MCRSTDHHGLGPVNRERLRIRSIVVGLSGLRRAQDQPLPWTLTLVFLPRGFGGAGVELVGSEVRPDAPAFVALHRRCGGAGGAEVEFGSAERVSVGSGARFEVFLREERVLRGALRREEGEWRLELSSAADGVVSAAEARVRVSAEGHVEVSQKVAVVAPRRRRFEGLEEIPEEEEWESDCDCGSDGGDLKREMDGGDGEMGMEGVGWAVDVGIWVMCLGVGFLVSKASSKT